MANKRGPLVTASYDLEQGWRELVAGGIDVHEIPGDHINIIKEPFVRQLARELRSGIDAASADKTNSLHLRIAA
jgi:thioesterase domain-containing protein